MTADREEAARRGSALAEGALGGDRRALARLLTAVENRTPVAEAALRRLHAEAGDAHLVGITGAPGAGKSTLVAALIGEVRASGRSVAVVAVDPSSPITGGAILGDRVRMQAYAADDGVFIRSMASRGHAGGLAAASVAAATVLDAAGFDLILLETVGTGQSEVEVAAAADTTVVLEAPEMGDEVQAIKAGLLEVADVVVVNKGDRPGAQRAAAELRAMLTATASPRLAGADPTATARTASGGPAAAPARPGPKRPEVLVTTATTGEGVPELLAAIERHRQGLGVEGGPAPVRRARAAALVWALLGDRVRRRLEDPALADVTAETLDAVVRHELDPYAAADRLLGALVGDAGRRPEGRDAGRQTSRG
ncbi:MAG: methylmalonyl Co-A mutase-associated GTPase MeaB [Chloroflexi bacterium]|nr:methylmalonyl Co-A mutase-associated GTPase MeaB [Chloroflexota bacterium]